MTLRYLMTAVETATNYKKMNLFFFVHFIIKHCDRGLAESSFFYNKIIGILCSRMLDRAVNYQQFLICDKRALKVS